MTGRCETHASDLSYRLRRLETNIIADETKGASLNRINLQRMIGSDVRERLREVNSRDVADWKTVNSRAAWERRTRARIDALRKSLGTYPQPPKDLNPRVTRSDTRDGYVVDNIVFESRPGLLVTAHLYRPLRAGTSMPGIIISHSHHRPKEQGELQDMGANWARRGCMVIVPDHIGHGERRQHSFRSASDYSDAFRVSRQDYYFRYNIGMQLHIAGDSLMGWMVWDLQRCVDFLMAQPGIDQKRIIILGAVAGGGDPSAVAAALDSRIAAAVPFNFGGPQPGERDRLGDDAENTISYSGSGGWESTRNLRLSARDGFFPYVIVGSLAPRKLIYAHEFNWDRKHDPLWRRFQLIWGTFYRQRENLAFTHGFGRVSQSSKQASHCTNIGPTHRRLIDPSLQRWYGISPPDEQKRDRRDTQQTLCLSGPDARDLAPTPVYRLATQLATARIASMRRTLEQAGSAAGQRRLLRAAWGRVLGNVEPYPATVESKPGEPLEGFGVDRIVIRGDRTIEVPVLLLSQKRSSTLKRPVVLMFAQSGKAELLRQRPKVIASLLAAGTTVCLPDLRGTGESNPGNYRGRRSAATGVSSSELMLGQTLVGSRLKDLRTIIAVLRKRNEIDATRIALWGDSVAPVNGPDDNVRLPLGIDTEPHASEPLGHLLALLGGLYEQDIVAVIAARGGHSSLLDMMSSQYCHFPHDIVIPGAAHAGDFADIATAIAPRPLLIAGLVNGVNRPVTRQTVESSLSPTRAAYRQAAAAEKFAVWHDSGDRPEMTRWLLRQLGK